MEKKPGLILVVDDEVELRRTLSDELQAVGYQTLQAGDGQQALELALAHRPHVILSDIQMPFKNGFELIGELRARNIEIPCVLFTGFNNKEKMMQAIRLGVVDFLEKPFDFNVLLEITDRAVQLGLEMRQLENALAHEMAGERPSPGPNGRAQNPHRRARLAHLVLWSGLESAPKKTG